MRFKSMVLAVTAALMLGVLAGPAAANKVPDKDGIPGGVKDSGIIDGTAKVGKARTGCTNDGTSTVSGPGLGLPTNAPKNAFYEFGNGGPATATSLFNGHVGAIKVCGRLTKMNSNVAGGTGAACGASKGYDGKGSIFFPAKGVTIWLSKVGWKASVTTFVVTGQAVKASSGSEAKGKKALADTLVAEIQAFGAGPCASKVDGPTKSGGATDFMITGTYEIAQGAPPDPNAAPGMCKRTGDPTCLNGDKGKDPTPSG